MPIGGAEERSPQGTILRAFVDLAGKATARIVIVPTASSDPTAGEDYHEVFQRIGAGAVAVATINSREEANRDDMVALVAQATGIFITGGDQARLSKLVVGTHAMEAIRSANAGGAVVAGTSAGASILGAHMIIPGPGTASDAAARKGMVQVVSGFGLLQDVIIDQHFSQRGRMGRLLAVFAANPGLLAVGLDENTAVMFDGAGILETLGSGMVTIIDGRTTVSDYFQRQEGEILSVTGSSLTALGPGRQFDLERREAVGIGG